MEYFLFTFLHFLNFLYVFTKYQDSLMFAPVFNESEKNPIFNSGSSETFEGLKCKPNNQKQISQNFYDILHITKPEECAEMITTRPVMCSTKKKCVYKPDECVNTEWNDDNSISFNLEIKGKLPLPKNGNKNPCDTNSNDCYSNDFLNFQNKSVKKPSLYQLSKKEQLNDVRLKISLETNLPNNIENENNEQSNFKLNANREVKHGGTKNTLISSNEEKLTLPKWPLPQLLKNVNNISSLWDANSGDINHNNKLISLAMKKKRPIIKLILMKNGSAVSENQYAIPDNIESFPNQYLTNLGDIHKSYNGANLKINRMHQLQSYNSSGSNVFRMKTKNTSNYNNNPSDSFETPSYYSILHCRNERKNQNNSSYRKI